MDIWRVSFPEEEARISIVYGMVTGNDSLHLPADMNITVSDPKMPDALPQTYRPIPSSGKYVMGLTPGKYNVSVEADGYNTINETLIILDKGSFLPEINKNFKLTKQLKK